MHKQLQLITPSGEHITIDDPLYGSFQISEPVLVDMIQNCKTFNRLAQVHQAGACYAVRPEFWNITRKEHSIGVMLLIRRLGGSIEEQLAGLLHDISHTAFSHVIDLVVKSKGHDFHDSLVTRFITQTDVKEVLEKHGYDAKLFAKNLDSCSDFHILECDLPNLCADRIDYTLRDLYFYFNHSQESIHTFVDSLVMVNNGTNIACKTIETAEWFVKGYQEEINFFFDAVNLYSYDVLADILKQALEKDVISMEEDIIMGTDVSVMERINTSGDESLIQQLNGMKRLDYGNIRVEQEPFEGYKYMTHRKRRFIDPLVKVESTAVPASTVSEQAAKMKQETLSKASTTFYLGYAENK